MRRICCFFFYILAGLINLENVFCCISNDSIAIIKPNFNKGEIRKYRIIQKTDVLFHHIEMISEISLIVKDIGATYVELEWDYDTIRQLDSLNQHTDLPDKNPNYLLLNGKKIKYRTDLDGNIKEIINFTELSEQIKSSIDRISQPNMHIMPPNYTASFILKDLVIFHQLNGTCLKIGDTTFLEKKLLFNPEIDLGSLSLKISLQGIQIPEGIILVFVWPVGNENSQVFFNSEYEFTLKSFWVRKYKSMMKIILRDSEIINEYELNLIP